MDRRQVSFLLAGVVLSGVLGCRCGDGSRVRYVPPPPGVGGMCDRACADGPMPPRYARNTTPVVPGAPAPAVVAPPPGAIPAPPPGVGAPPPGAWPAPPTNASPPPPPAFSPPTNGPSAPPPAFPPPGGGIQQNGYTPPASIPSPPASSGAPKVYLDQPEPVAPEPAKPMPGATGTPEPARPMPNAPTPPPETRPSTPQSPEPPPARDDRAASPTLPVDIPQFAMVKTNIASGQEPFAEGVAWLKNHGYRTVLHIRPPGEEDSAARRRFEQGGLRYLSLEVSPQTLSREVVEQFNRLVADASNLPLFVYDKDGSLAGGLWYLHFRLVDRASDEKAREEAEHLGFRQDGSDSHVKMWLAVQNLLKDLKP